MHYRLIAFVGRGKDDPAPLWSGDEGYQSFSDIFNRRPDWSRFAILQNTDKKYLCVDLFEVTLSLDDYRLDMPALLEFDDLDARSPLDLADIAERLDPTTDPTPVQRDTHP